MLETKVEAFLNRHSFQLENKRLVVGVSGGPDSLALLHYLMKLKDKQNLSIVAAHVDHMFRGQESFEDALFVKNFCEDNEIPFEMVQADVSALMEKTGESPEAAAREVRYHFFQEIMERYQSPYLVLGHHGDDQIETILMRLTRGSTGMARAGIRFARPFASGMIIRPFLCLTKAEIEDYCTRYHLTPRMDPSNLEDLYTRNRYRQHILPFLKKENPLVHEHFQRFSEDVQTDEDYLQELTVQALNTVVKKRETDRIIIDSTRLLEVPLPLQRRGIQLILNYLYKERPSSLSAVHIDQLFQLIRHGGPSAKLDFPDGLKVNRSYQDLVVEFASSVEGRQEAYYIELNEPGTVKLPNGEMIEIEYVNEIPKSSAFTALFPSNRIKWPLIIRTRKNGDRMTLKGMKGSKKIKDIFIDQKINLFDRGMWPVITDREGCIIWLPGLKKSSFEGKDTTAETYILLTYKKY